MTTGRPAKSQTAPKATSASSASVKSPSKTEKPTNALAKKTAAPGKIVVKKAAPRSPSTTIGKPPVSGEQRLHYIEVAAYYIAERRGFADANPHENWAQAEMEIDRLLGEGKLNP